MTKTRKKQLLLISFVSALFVLVVLGTKTTFAALKIESATVKNSFTAMENSIPLINETVIPDPNQSEYILEKNNVTITNNNDFEVCVRAMVIASWQDSNGDTLASLPTEGTDFQITYGSEWEKKSDGFYYYKSVLAKGETTPPLLTGCKPLKAAPVDGYTLSLNIVSQTVQSEIDNGEIPFDDSYQ